VCLKILRFWLASLNSAGTTYVVEAQTYVSSPVIFLLDQAGSQTAAPSIDNGLIFSLLTDE
jgi:hypothetical protein